MAQSTNSDKQAIRNDECLDSESSPDLENSKDTSERNLRSLSPPPDTTTTTAQIKYASLEEYIIQTENLEFEGCFLPRERVFRSEPHFRSPTLRSDRENRILLYPGYFNPPHHGHCALLWHTFLCTDDHTVALVVVLKSDAYLGSKAQTEVGDWSFKLNSYQRAQLWHDPILSRFMWVQSEDSISDYTQAIQDLA